VTVTPGLPGNGPWAILADCPARNHNTVSSARATHHGRARPACICYGARKAFAAWKTAIQSRPAEQRRGPRARGISLPELRPKPSKVPTPDLRAGLCQTPRGQEAFADSGNMGLTNKSIEARDRAKRLCNTAPCPVWVACRAWVKAGEDPPGSWGGVYGGLDAWNRRGGQVVMRDGKAALIPFDEGML
jgi:hypothetical protein